MLRNTTLFVALAIAATGCVGKKKYTALQAEFDATKVEMSGKLDTETAKSTSLEEELAAEKARTADLEHRINELLSDKSKLDASVAELIARKEAADARIAEYQDLMGKFKALIDAGRLKVKIVGGRMIVELASDILFPSGSAALSDEGKAAIREVASVLATIQDRKFQVEGHTDNDPIKTERFPSNWELGAGRAITVVQALKDGGVPVENLSAASFAQFQPVAANDSKENKATNRRIEIVVVPDLSLLPGYDELAKLAKQ